MSLMSVTIFRGLMSAFTDDTKWPDDTIQMALDEAEAETESTRWGDYDDTVGNFRNRGIRLFAAAWLVNNFGDKGVGSKVAETGEARLNVASKSVGDESVAYRVPSMMEVSDDWLTWSHYGQQYYRLRKRAGMGAIVV